MTEQNYHDRERLYRAAAGLNQSALKPLRISPAHAKAALEAERKTSEAMAIGILTERVIAGAGVKAIVLPHGNNERAAYNAAVAEHTEAGRITKSGTKWVGLDGWIVTDGDMLAKCERMAANVKASADAQALLAGAAYCQPCYWQHNGQPRKALFDAVSIDGNTVRIVDLKTTSSDLTPDDLAKDIAKWGYHLQAAWYLQGARAMWPDLQVEFWFVFVESAAPHCVVAVQLDDDWLASGAAEVEVLAEVWQACSDAGVWPGPAEMAVNGESTFPRKLSRPKWSRAYSLEV